MIEGESDFVGEEQMMRAIEVGHAAVRDLCLGERPPPPPPRRCVFFSHGTPTLQFCSPASVQEGGSVRVVRAACVIVVVVVVVVAVGASRC